jgi:hypothetical protein
MKIGSHQDGSSIRKIGYFFRKPGQGCLSIFAVCFLTLLFLSCDDDEMCSEGVRKRWCDGDVVMICSKSTMSDWEVDEWADCREEYGLTCYEYLLSTHGHTDAGCLISEEPCPEQRRRICIGDFLGNCEATGLPLVDSLGRYCPNLDQVCVQDGVWEAHCQTIY